MTVLLNMLPCFASQDGLDVRVTDSIYCRNLVKRNLLLRMVGILPPHRSNCSNIVFGQLGFVVSLPGCTGSHFKRCLSVASRCNPLKILKSIVRAIGVLVMTDMPQGGWPHEGHKNKTVNGAAIRLAVSTQADSMVLPTWKRSKDASSSRVANTSLAADLVHGKVFNNLPLLNHSHSYLPVSITGGKAL